MPADRRVTRQFTGQNPQARAALADVILKQNRRTKRRNISSQKSHSTYLEATPKISTRCSPQPSSQAGETKRPVSPPIEIVSPHNPRWRNNHLGMQNGVSSWANWLNDHLPADDRQASIEKVEDWQNHLVVLKGKQIAHRNPEATILLTLVLNSQWACFEQLLQSRRDCITEHILEKSNNLRQTDTFLKAANQQFVELFDDGNFKSFFESQICLYESDKTQHIGEALDRLQHMGAPGVRVHAKKFFEQHFQKDASINLGSKQEVLSGFPKSWCCFDALPYASLPTYQHGHDPSTAADETTLWPEEPAAGAVIIKKGNKLQRTTFALLQKNFDIEFGAHRNPIDDTLLVNGTLFRYDADPSRSICNYLSH